MKIDIGCGSAKFKGPNKDDDSWIGLDRIKFDGVDYCIDIGNQRWPFADESVSEAHSSHFLEHLSAIERIRFCNELHRVLIPGGKCALIVPHWSSSRAYGDPTHQWPAIGEFWFLYLDKTWRQSQAPATDAAYWPEGYNCDFASQIAYFVNPVVNALKDEMRNIAIAHGREIILDINASLIKK